MLSRAFTTPKRTPKHTYSTTNNSLISGSILESESCLVGFMDDLPLDFCGDVESKLSLREVLRASVGVIGESPLGITEKVVLLGGCVYVLKRFRRVHVRGRREFMKKIERLAEISRECEYLVPVIAFLYTKRIKFVLSPHFPIGSLADLLAGGRERGHTALDWNQRLTIILCIAQAIAFIHAQTPAYHKNMQLNVHGNIKATNVLINVDFRACVSDYGYTQLAAIGESVAEGGMYCQSVSQKSDVFNFGVVVLDVLGGPSTIGLREWIVERKEEIKEGKIEFFEFGVDMKGRRQALKVLEIGLACTRDVEEYRPSIEMVVRKIGDVIIK